MLVALKRIGCDVWQLECQANSVQSYMLLVFFVTDKSHRTPRTAEIQPISQPASATTPYRGLVRDTCAPPISCPRRGNRAMQVIESTIQQ